MALREHSSLNKKAQFDEALNTFFRNVDIKKSQDTVEIPVGKGTEKIRNLRARAVLIDTEEGVVNEIMKGPLNEVFDHRQYVSQLFNSYLNFLYSFSIAFDT